MRPGTLLSVAPTLVRTFGVRGAWFRAIHEGRRLANVFRSAPKHALQTDATAESVIRIDPARLRDVVDRSLAIDRADRVVGGEYQAYRNDWRLLPCDASDWHRHPRTGFIYDAAAPWWRIPHFHAPAGDIKDIWEPARFAWAYDLARGFIVSGDRRYADAFAGRLLSWSAGNAPYRGVHWSCGQETGVRALALLHAEAAFASALDQRTQRVLLETLAASGERIADALEYALSQRNNHAISEASALIALGTRLRDAHPDADAWRSRGVRWLEYAIVDQFAEDGWYAQHSFNYLRLALHQCIVAQHVLGITRTGLSETALGRLRAACDLISAVMDPETGVVPNHGANDGALVHPVTLAPFRDYRPVLAAACASFDHPLDERIAIDAEPLAWLSAPAPRRRPRATDGIRTGASGWATAQVAGVHVFLRAGRYRTRPSHLDPLHVDIRIRRDEHVVDPGSYAYFGPAPWANGLVSGRVHNGPMLDEREPGVRGPRFLWLEWPRASIRATRFDGRSAILTAEIPGVVRRTVTVSASEVRVHDEALRTKFRTMRVCWLLHPDVTQPKVQCTVAYHLVEASEGDVVGWFSAHYGQRVRSRALVIEARLSDARSVTTTFTAP